MSEEKGIIKYKTMSGQDITLSKDIVRKYLVHGKGTITDQEIMMFLALCKYQNLNPFLREAYLIKYGSEPATIVTGKETFLKRAVKHDRYQGHKTGITENGTTAWAEIYVKDYVTPIRCEADYNEYVGRKSDGTVNRMWKEKPRTMLKKVALVQALREAFPEDFGGMYSPEEINTVQAESLPITEVVIPDEKGNGDEKPAGETEEAPKTEWHGKLLYLLIETYNGDIDKMKEALIELTTWEKDGKVHPGKEKLNDLSEKMAQIAYAKLKNLVQETA